MKLEVVTWTGLAPPAIKGGAERGHQIYTRNQEKSISTGWRTSATGPFASICGTLHRRRFWYSKPRLRRGDSRAHTDRRVARSAAATTSTRTPTCSTRGSRRRSGRTRRWAGPIGRRPRAVTTQGLCSRPGTTSCSSGWPHDHDGHRNMGEILPHGVPPWPRARRWREDEQVQGERDQPGRSRRGITERTRFASPS